MFGGDFPRKYAERFTSRDRLCAHLDVALAKLQDARSKAAAEDRKAELIHILKTCAEPDSLAGGPPMSRSGPCSAARTLRCGSTRWERCWGGGHHTGKAAHQHISGPEAHEFVAKGYLMITGWNQPR